jgi:DNA-binding winged helix-turn-helix (wHTH) protein
MKVFFPFQFDTSNQCLWRRGDTGQEERVLLTPKAFAVLDHLVEHAGRLVTHEELLEAVWPDTVVEPEAVKRYVVAVRSALGGWASPPPIGLPAFSSCLAGVTPSLKCEAWLSGPHL